MGLFSKKIARFELTRDVFFDAYQSEYVSADAGGYDSDYSFPAGHQGWVYERRDGSRFVKFDNHPRNIMDVDLYAPELVDAVLY